MEEGKSEKNVAPNKCQILQCTVVLIEKIQLEKVAFISVDPGIMNQPIRFKLTAKTDDPKYLANSQVIPYHPS